MSGYSPISYYELGRTKQRRSNLERGLGLALRIGGHDFYGDEKARERQEQQQLVQSRQQQFIRTLGQQAAAKERQDALDLEQRNRADAWRKFDITRADTREERAAAAERARIDDEANKNTAAALAAQRAAENARADATARSKADETTAETTVPRSLTDLGGADLGTDEEADAYRAMREEIKKTNPGLAAALGRREDELAQSELGKREKAAEAKHKKQTAKDRADAIEGRFRRRAEAADAARMASAKTAAERAAIQHDTQARGRAIRVTMERLQQPFDKPPIADMTPEQIEAEIDAQFAREKANVTAPAAGPAGPAGAAFGSGGSQGPIGGAGGVGPAIPTPYDDLDNADYVPTPFPPAASMPPATMPFTEPNAPTTQTASGAGASGGPGFRGAGGAVMSQAGQFQNPAPFEAAQIPFQSSQPPERPSAAGEAARAQAVAKQQADAERLARMENIARLRANARQQPEPDGPIGYAQMDGGERVYMGPASGLAQNQPLGDNEPYAESGGRRVTATSMAVNLLQGKTPQAKQAAIDDMRARPEEYRRRGIDVEAVLATAAAGPA